MKKSTQIIIYIMVIGFIITLGITYAINDNGRNYDTKYFTVNYDSSWKLQKGDYEFRLVHKKSDSILDIQSKVLDDNYIDTKLSDIVSDIVYGIEEQNSDYKLINMMNSPTDKYESYSYLYEKDDEQVLVNVYKQDEVLIIAYYQAESKYYDIVLDSVDTILGSLDIISGEKVN